MVGVAYLEDAEGVSGPFSDTNDERNMKFSGGASTRLVLLNTPKTVPQQGSLLLSKSLSEWSHDITLWHIN